MYLAEDDAGTKYAVKHLPVKHAEESFGRATPNAHANRTKAHLARYFEAAATTSCLDMITVGNDQMLLLQLGEGAVNYASLNLADLIAVFQDLQDAYEYGRKFMNIDVTPDVSVLHLDLHGDNLMRFGGRLRMIDFGFALIFSGSQGEAWRGIKAPAYDSQNPNLYLQDGDLIQDRKRFVDQNSGSWKPYIDKWKAAYKVPPIRKADIIGTAKLKGVSPASVGDAPYANRAVGAVTMQQYGCIVLTAVLIKEIWAATEAASGDLGMARRRARDINNAEAYPLARTGLHKFKDAKVEAGGVMELLLFWYDEMMRRLFDGPPFTPKDAITFFGGTRKAVPVGRERRHSTSF